jgi:predicted dehydrogenase
VLEWSADWRRVVEADALDVIVIAVPPERQPEIARTAFAAGKHVFCEKPVGTNELDVESVLRQARRSGRAHAVDFELAETDAFRQAKSVLEGGRIGPLRHAIVSWHVETWAYRGGPATWKLASEHGGGTLSSFVSHVFHYVEWFFGPTRRIAARLLPDAAGDAVALVWLELDSGAPVSIAVSANAPAGSGHRIEIYGETGSLILENTGKDYARGFGLTFRNREGLVEQLPPEPQSLEDGRIEAGARLVTRFLDAALGGPMCRPGLEEGLRVQHLIEAARRSDAEGCWRAV